MSMFEAKRIRVHDRHNQFTFYIRLSQKALVNSQLDIIHESASKSGIMAFARPGDAVAMDSDTVHLFKAFLDHVHDSIRRQRN